MEPYEQFEDVDNQIYDCLSLDDPKSFFLFAGAGSGKTGSLVKVLKKFRKENIQRLRATGQKVAIITYTNAACDEIRRRLEFDTAFSVSTIHSFCWELIKDFQHDIKIFIGKAIQADIETLEGEQRKGRTGTKAAIERPIKIEAKKRRLALLDGIKVFTYNPNGNSFERDSLNHAEVMKIASSFFYKPILGRILVQKFPILLIDESQDTNKELIDAFFYIQNINKNRFLLGLFGDTMQRIYLDGKNDLAELIPDSWEKPEKRRNYRCPNRVVSLINQIRLEDDGQEQETKEGVEEGTVHLYLVDSNNSFLDRPTAEIDIARRMLELTGDHQWVIENNKVKVLTLEHKMAARRGGFLGFFEPLASVKSFYTGLLDETLFNLPFLIKQILPLVQACRVGNQFAIAQIIKKYSPLLEKKSLKESSKPIENITKAKEAIDFLIRLWDEEQEPSIFQVVQNVMQMNVLNVPSDFKELIDLRVFFEVPDVENNEGRDEKNVAWESALEAPFSQLEAYSDYISDNSLFGTHQGVKGLEFERVLVVLDDDEAAGFLFSYEKLLGAKDLSETDLKNEDVGRDNSPRRTRRLFYVTCSRAQKSLAVVAYTKDPQTIKGEMIRKNWFAEEEISIYSH